MCPLPVNTGIGILKPLQSYNSGIVELVNDSKRNLLLLNINHQRQCNLFASCDCAIISQINLERVGYPMLQQAFADCLNLLELFLANKVIFYTIINHSSKLGTMWAGWYNYQCRLKVHGRYKTSMLSRSQVINRSYRQLWYMCIPHAIMLCYAILYFTRRNS